MRKGFIVGDFISAKGLESQHLGRRYVLAGLTAAAAVSVLPSCQVLGKAAANPAVRSWLRDFSVALGAGTLVNLTEKISNAINEWGVGFQKLYKEWFPKADGACSLPRETYLSSASPEFLTVPVSHGVIKGYIAAGTCASPDYLNDGCALVINKGEDGIYLPGWAWQTLLLFCGEMTKGLSGKDLNQKRALLRVALAPVSSKVKEETTWSNAISALSYKTHMGPVDIAKIEQPDHTYKGFLKVGGFPDEKDEGSVWEFSLPTKAG